jgi:L-ascorbate metabolism protein UlaG (beta-lactamase superfamily)
VLGIDDLAPDVTLRDFMAITIRQRVGARLPTPCCTQGMAKEHVCVRVRDAIRFDRSFRVRFSFSYLRQHLSRRDFRILKTLLADCWRPILPASHKPQPLTWPDDAITGAWLGHATILLNFFGVRILTDPVLGSRCGLRIGPLTIGPKRCVRPALKVRELPPIDLVLLTHAHMDHLDWWTLKRLPTNSAGAQAVAARETGDLLIGMPFKKVIELGWGDATEVQTAAGKVRVEAFRVNHWGARMRHDTHRGYNGYLIERGDRRIGIAGDTAFTDFSHVCRPGGIDLMAVPIGAYNPWIASHCTPEQAIAMANQAGAKRLLPVHHQTFKLSAEPMREPIERFTQALAHEPERIIATEIGETFTLK